MDPDGARDRGTSTAQLRGLRDTRAIVCHVAAMFTNVAE